MAKAEVYFVTRLKEKTLYDEQHEKVQPALPRSRDGPSNFDWPVAALDRWVTSGVAPETIIGTSNDSKLTRPICAWPDVARLKNSFLDPNLPSNFNCRKDMAAGGEGDDEKP